MSEEFKVYVIFKDGKPFKKKGYKTVYLNKASAKSVITSESKYDAKYLCDEYYKNNNINKRWFEVGEKEINKWVEKARKHYEVKEFIENKGETNIKNNENDKYIIVNKNSSYAWLVEKLINNDGLANMMVETIARNCTAWDTSKDKKEGLLPEVSFTNKFLYKKINWRRLYIL